MLSFRMNSTDGYDSSLPTEYDSYVRTLKTFLNDTHVVIRQSIEIYGKLFDCITRARVSLTPSFLSEVFKDLGSGLFHVFLNLYDRAVDTDTNFVQLRLHVGQPSKALRTFLFLGATTSATALEGSGNGEL